MFHVKHGGSEQGLDPELIRDALSACGVLVTDQQSERLAEHARLVLEMNEVMNLTRITDPAAVIQLHIADSMAFIPHIGPLSGRGVDVGSGAGYPGIPLGILGLSVDLCESVRKKAAFLGDVVSALGLEASVWPLRAEKLALEDPAAYDYVIFRAVSSLPSLVELAAPLLCPGGRMVALKGPIEPEELDAGAKAGRLCGMALETQSSYRLPGGEARTVVVYSRKGRPHTPLPRRPGMAQRYPLG